MPYYSLVADMKDRKRADEDYGLKRQWETENRNIAKELRTLEQQRYGEDKAYKLSRDTKEDMWKQEQRDYNAEDRLINEKRYQDELGFKTTDQKRQAEKDIFDRTIATETLKIQQRLAEVKGLNPEAASILTQVESLYKSLPSAYETGDAQNVKSITDKITELNTQYKQLTNTAPAADPNMGLGKDKVRGTIPPNIKAQGVPQITLPSNITTTSQALQFLKQQGMNDAQAAQWIRENN